MTEAEWLACADPMPMLAFLRGKASDRKLRLFALACCRRIWHRLIDPRSQEAIDTAERYADGLAVRDELDWTFVGALLAESDTVEVVGEQDNLYYAAFAARHTNSPQMTSATEVVALNAGRAVAESGSSDCSRLAYEQANQSILARDIFGNPFKQVSINSFWTISNDGTVAKLAQVIYNDRRFEDMPILADALIDAGCHDEEILNHCRGEGPHARGCWVLDLLLGKED